MTLPHHSRAAASTVDGVIVRQVAAAGGPGIFSGVAIEGGALRLQACQISSASGACIYVSGGAGTDPAVIACECEFFFFFLRAGPHVWHRAPCGHRWTAAATPHG